jgi:hypothetical protein
MYARRAKASHRDTISYEIDMLAFCAEKLTHSGGSGSDGDSALSLEGFLLHYRNLIRFFSGKHHRNDDISTHNCQAWAGRELSTSEVTTIKQPAAALDDAYYDSISKYLQHCTSMRHEHDRSWDVQTMAGQLAPIIDSFERAFPRRNADSARLAR